MRVSQHRRGENVVIREDLSERHKALVSKLAISHHARSSHRALLTCGPDALPAIREGLRHQSADVRYWCCQFLDRFLVPAMMDDLIAMLDDPDNRVRCSALHTLSCDRCKEGSCRPEEAKLMPRAIALVAGDPDPHVRAQAIGLAGRWVHTNADVEAVLLNAMKSDPSPAVRKKASWFVPGGTIYQRTIPRGRSAAGRKHAPIDAITD
jgi:HEAT repeat protein